MGILDFFKRKKKADFEKVDFDKFSFDNNLDDKKGVSDFKKNEINSNNEFNSNIQPNQNPPNAFNSNQNLNSQMPNFNDNGANNSNNQFNSNLNLNSQQMYPPVPKPQNQVNEQDIKEIKKSLELIQSSIDSLNKRTLKIEKEVTRRW